MAKIPKLPDLDVDIPKNLQKSPIITDFGVFDKF